MKVRGHVIKRLRRERGWTQQQLASFADLNISTVQRMEQQHLASKEGLKALASILELDPSQLVSPRPHRARTAWETRLALTLVPASLLLGFLLGSAFSWQLLGQIVAIWR